MNEKTKPNLKENSLTIIFDEWKKRSIENPEDFDWEIETGTYGRDCAKYFIELENELLEAGKLPKAGA